jgi:hypothetical protein
MTVKDAAKLYAVSDRTVKRWKQEQTNGGALPARTTAKASPAPSVPENSTTGPSPIMEEKPPAIAFQDSPAPVDAEKKNIIDQGLDSIKGMLGIKDVKGEKKQAPPLSAKLDPKRQAFVDNITPTLTLAFIAVATAMWQRIGPEYKQLAPDETVANRIVEPLIRVYARHAVFLTEINPDVADIGASVFALAGYIYASLALYQKIKEDKEAYEQAQSPGPYNRDYRNPAATENTANNPVNGYADVSRTSQGDVRGHSQNGGDAHDISRTRLAPKEQAQFEALSRLAELDYQSRLRRSGYLH